MKWNPSFWKTKPRRLGDYKKRITANLPITYKENEPRFVRHSINAHVEPRLIFNGKNTHKTTTTKHNQEKSRVQPPKSGKTSEKAARTSETQKRNEQKRRLRARSELRPQSEKKEGCENPSKSIGVVLWNETHRFEKPNPVVLGIIKERSWYPADACTVSSRRVTGPPRPFLYAKVHTKQQPPNKITKKKKSNKIESEHPQNSHKRNRETNKKQLQTTTNETAKQTKARKESTV